MSKRPKLNDKILRDELEYEAAQIKNKREFVRAFWKKFPKDLSYKTGTICIHVNPNLDKKK
jgi:hypothetical protein